MPDTTVDSYNALYAARMKQGEGFERFSYRRLAELGLRPRHSQSRREQLEIGENDLGIEIKFNSGHWIWDTLYIETHEKSHPKNPEFVPSGIYRLDNALHYLIGDRRKFWIFRVDALRALHQHKRPAGGWVRKRVENDTGTSRGFRLPLDVADRNAVFVWTAGEGWTQVAGVHVNRT